ncbi:MAG: hypothetical protein HRF50_02065 [Phycisphaerae bacterium]
MRASFEGLRPTGGRRNARRGSRCAPILLLLLLGGGCTGESLRAALDAQRRADAVQQAVFDCQHEALRILLFRDLLAELERGGGALTAGQRATVNRAWNDRDLFEFWAVQHERARALRMVGVDVKLYSDQSIVDLLYKQMTAKLDRLKQVGAEIAGKGLSAPAGE